MIKSGTVVCILLILGSFADVGSGQPGVATLPPVVGAEGLDRVGYHGFWEIALPLGNDSVLGSHLLDENLYVTTRAGFVFAIQADTGLLRWVQNLGATLVRDRAPTHVQTPSGEGPVVFVTHSAVRVFDRYSGDEVRSFELPFPAGGGAVANRDLMCLGSAAGRLHSLRWSADPRSAALQWWEVAVKGVVASTPVSIFDRWYVVSSGGAVYCVRPEDKLLHWASRIGGSVSGGLHVDESGVYVASTDRSLRVLDADTGERIRTYKLPGPLYDAPDVVQRTCYQHCPGAGLYAFDVDTREQLWVGPHARRFVARAAENLVLLSETDGLLFVDNETGTVRHTLDLPNRVSAVRNTRDGVLYLVAADGRIACATPKGYPYLRRDAVRRSRAGLSQPPSAAQDGLVNPSIVNDPGQRVSSDPLRSANRG